MTKLSLLFLLVLFSCGNVEHHAMKFDLYCNVVGMNLECIDDQDQQFIIQLPNFNYNISEDNNE